MNKKGTDKILSIYWFAILFIVASGIVYMTAMFYGNPYDVREMEANILTNKIADCLVSGGELNDISSMNDENILGICNLNFDVEDTEGWNNDQHYIKIEFYDFNSPTTSIKDISAGNVNLNNFCNTPGKNNPFCLERNFYTLDAGQRISVKITSIVKKTEKNAN